VTAELTATQPAGGLPPEWMRRGLCAGSPTPDLWFPEVGDSKSATEAKRVCRGCPVRADCLAYAIALRIRHGVWGATTPDERDGRKERRTPRPMDPATRNRKTQAERKRRRRLRDAAAAGDREAAERLERERPLTRTAGSVTATHRLHRKDSPR
jgi:WhiB family redox-sensing transcriptional regulator